MTPYNHEKTCCPNVYTDCIPITIVQFDQFRSSSLGKLRTTLTEKPTASRSHGKAMLLVCVPFQDWPPLVSLSAFRLIKLWRPKVLNLEFLCVFWEDSHLKPGRKTQPSTLGTLFKVLISASHAEDQR